MRHQKIPAGQWWGKERFTWRLALKSAVPKPVQTRLVPTLQAGLCSAPSTDPVCPPSGSACSHSPAKFAAGPQRGSAHPSLSMQPFFAACGNPLPPAPLALQIKPQSNFGLCILLPSPPVLSCLTSYEDGAGPGAAGVYKAPSVGTRGHARRWTVRPLAEPHS